MHALLHKWTDSHDLFWCSLSFASNYSGKNLQAHKNCTSVGLMVMWCCTLLTVSNIAFVLSSMEYHQFIVLNLNTSEISPYCISWISGCFWLKKKKDILPSHFPIKLLQGADFHLCCIFSVFQTKIKISKTKHEWKSENNFHPSIPTFSSCGDLEFYCRQK